MATESNQPSSPQDVPQTLNVDGLRNLTFLTETLDKLNMGSVFNMSLRQSMLDNADVFEKSAVFTLEDTNQKLRVTPRIEKTEGENGGPFYVLKGFRAG